MTKKLGLGLIIASFLLATPFDEFFAAKILGFTVQQALIISGILLLIFSEKITQRITKKEINYIGFFTILGLGAFMVSAGIRDYLLELFGNGPNQIIIGVIILLLLAYFVNLERSR